MFLFVCFGKKKAKYHKNYRDTEEEQTRKQIYVNNLKTMDLHNARFDRGEETYLMRENERSDMLHEEFLKNSMGVVSMTTFNRRFRA